MVNDKRSKCKTFNTDIDNVLYIESVSFFDDFLFLSLSLEKLLVLYLDELVVGPMRQNKKSSKNITDRPKCSKESKALRQD